MTHFWIVLGRFVFGKLLPKGVRLPILRGPLKGMRFIHGSAAGEGGGARILFGLMEPEQTYALSSSIKPGSIVFDVGANVGYYTLLAARQAGNEGSVIAFEPVARNLRYLWEHVHINKVANVQILGVACSESSSIRMFASGPNYALGHLAQAINLCDANLVATVTIDEVAELTGIPDVIKIDVEGAEYDVLVGASRCLKSQAPTIFLSVHSDELRESCSRYLTSLGYVLDPISGNIRNATEFVARRR